MAFNWRTVGFNPSNNYLSPKPWTSALNSNFGQRFTPTPQATTNQTTPVPNNHWSLEDLTKGITHSPHYQNDGMYNYFPAEQILGNRQKAYAQSNPGLSNVYGGLTKELWAFWNTAKQITGFYDSLANDIVKRENELAAHKSFLNNELVNRIAEQQNYVNQMYGLNGYLTNQVNAYYDDLWNYLATEGGRQMAEVDAQGMHTGASLGAIRAAKNEAYNQAFGNYVKAKEQEFNAKERISNQLVQFMTALRNEYGNTNDKYILQQYQRANDLLNGISSNIAQEGASLAKMKLQQAMSNARRWTSNETVTYQTPNGETRTITMTDFDSLRFHLPKDTLIKTAQGNFIVTDNTKHNGLVYGGLDTTNRQVGEYNTPKQN